MDGKLRILLKFHRGYGLGDTVQFSVVLRHLAKYRPNWSIDFVADRGRHSAARGLVNAVYTYDDPPKGQYDAEHLIVMYDNAARDTDFPNTRVVACLRDKFGIEYDRELGRYQVSPHPSAYRETLDYLLSVGCKVIGSPEYAMGKWYSKMNAVLIHHKGASSPERKDLPDAFAKAMAEAAIRLGRIPLILDWDRRRADKNDPLWGGDVETNCALIGQSEAFIGIDSGPAKCASATDTPSLVCWTKHHPMQFHDPAPNTTHLVPADHADMSPIKGNANMLEFFEREYKWLTYADGGLTKQAIRWLEGTVKHGQ